jgi:hypothetical protein
MDLLQQQNVAKVIAEPKLTTVSGRPASVNVGGEFPILVPQSLGTVSIQYRKFGTQVDFVPIVLGNGVIRLEVRPRVSEIDDSRSIVINGTSVPGLRVREVDTGAEMRAGQTLAIAGLVQFRSQNQKRSILWMGDLPIIGAAFRNMQTQINEIELLILVTPQLVEAMDPCEVPTIGPGLATAEPSDLELVVRGHVEVPLCDTQNGLMGPYPPGTPGSPGTGDGQRPWKSQLPPGAVEVVPAPEEEGTGESTPAPGPSARRNHKPRVTTTRSPQMGTSSRRVTTRSEDAMTSGYMGDSGTAQVSDQLNPKNPPRANPRKLRTGTASMKSLPGLIGPTGNDLR